MFYYYLLSIVSDDDFLRISSLQSGLSLAFLSQFPGGIPFRARFLLMVSLKRSFGLPMLRINVQSCNIIEIKSDDVYWVKEICCFCISYATTWPYWYLWN